MKKSLITLLLALLTIMAACRPSAGDEMPSQSPGGSISPAVSPAPGEKMELYVLNWGDYMDDEVLANFRAEYPNITLHYETAASNEEMLVQLESGNSIYDVCFPSEYAIERLMSLDLLHEIDHTKITNLGNIDENFLNLAYDPGNRYSIPYMWGTIGILYNKSMVQEEVDSWGILWDERYKGQILMYDSIRDSIGITLKKLGVSMNTRNPEDIAAAEKELIEQKPLVLAYGTDDLKDKMKSGSASLCVIYNGDAVECMEENDMLAYAVPNEGSNMWFDSAVILKSSKNVGAAHLFIDYLCRAEVAARNTEYLGYSSPNKAALELISDERKGNPAYLPPQDVIDRCEVFGDLGDFINVYNDAWLRIKAFKVK